MYLLGLLQGPVHEFPKVATEPPAMAVACKLSGKADRHRQKTGVSKLSRISSKTAGVDGIDDPFLHVCNPEFPSLGSSIDGGLSAGLGVGVPSIIATLDIATIAVVSISR